MVEQQSKPTRAEIEAVLWSIKYHKDGKNTKKIMIDFLLGRGANSDEIAVIIGDLSSYNHWIEG